MRGNHLVREARKRAGLTQAELAARAGTTQSAIARLESGATTPTLETISKLVRAAGFDLTIGIAKTDDDHDWSLVQQNLRLTPTQRVEKSKKALRFMMDLREAGRAAGVGRR
jgi:transcriptional regulator with XRE-family HTH domain